jgi:hypothetical protein
MDFRKFHRDCGAISAVEVKLPYSTEQYITLQDSVSPEPQGGAVDNAEVLGNDESGTARARRLLTGRMAELARPAKVTAQGHADELERLARKLSYMDGAQLAGLCDLVLHHAGSVALKGKAAPMCPPLAMVQAWAYALAAPPVSVSDYPASVLRSAMGRRAYDAGYGVELFRMARRMGPPPGAYSLTQLRDEAGANRMRRQSLRSEIEAGRSVPPNRQAWLDAWHQDALLVEGLIAEGDARREARAAAQGDAA